MTNYIVRRLLYMLVVLFVVAGITFILMHAVPGGPRTGGAVRGEPDPAQRGCFRLKKQQRQ